MAYTIFPKTVEELTDLHDNAKSLVPLFELLTKEGFDIPLGFEPGNKRDVKILRLGATKVDLDTAIKMTNNPALKLDFGNGSRNGLGTNNQGHKYEHRIFNGLVAYVILGAEAFHKYPTDKKDIEKILAKAVPTGYFVTDILPAGGANNKRSVPITESGIRTVSDADADIGSTISDITIISRNNNGLIHREYVSAKFGDTVSFLSLGVQQWFPQSDIAKGKITNNTGKRLLDILGIDHERFCETFNTYKPNSKKKTTEAVSRVDINVKELRNLIKSTVGHGYIMVHKQSSSTKIIRMNYRNMMENTKIDKVTVHYPENGSIKSVRVNVVMRGLTIDFTIRATNGKVYPTHMVANYKYTKIVGENIV